MHAVLTGARRGHPGLFWLAAAMAALAIACAALSVVDQRTLLGAPLWFKPLKFAISVGLYSAAMAWMLGRLPVGTMRWTGWVLVVTAAIEMLIITGQAARGVQSHFNEDGGTGELLFSVMAASIAVLYIAGAVIAVRFLRERHLERTVAVAIRLGMLVALLGMSVGIVMSALGSHAVGVPDGGPGLPFVGWSTTGGDLRIAHFVGLHALQLLPLLGVALTTKGWFDPRARSQVVMVAAAGYTVLVLLLTWQALRAQPLLAPDGPTLAALAALGIGVVGPLLLVRRAAVGRAGANQAGAHHAGTHQAGAVDQDHRASVTVG